MNFDIGNTGRNVGLQVSYTLEKLVDKQNYDMIVLQINETSNIDICFMSYIKTNMFEKIS